MSPFTQARCEQHHNRTPTCCESLQSPCQADTRITANFLQSEKNTLTSSRKVTEKLEQMIRQSFFEPVQPRGVTNASPVLCQRKKSGELTLCVALKMHINGKVMDEDYPIPDLETIFHKLHGVSYFGKIELDEEAKMYAQSTHLRPFKMCQLLQGLKNSSSIFQNCIESTLKGIKGVVIFVEDVLVYETSNTSGATNTNDSGASQQTSCKIVQKTNCHAKSQQDGFREAIISRKLSKSV